jgi:hypothetical protein
MTIPLSNGIGAEMFECTATLCAHAKECIHSKQHRVRVQMSVTGEIETLELPPGIPFTPTLGMQFSGDILVIHCRNLGDEHAVNPEDEL